VFDIYEEEIEDLGSILVSVIAELRKQ